MTDTTTTHPFRNRTLAERAESAAAMAWYDLSSVVRFASVYAALGEFAGNVNLTSHGADGWFDDDSDREFYLTNDELDAVTPITLFDDLLDLTETR